MENSIEEDIKILEELNETYRFLISFRTKKIPADKKLAKRIQAIEHILSDYKKVLKENEELKEKNESLELEEKRRIIGRYGEVERPIKYETIFGKAEIEEKTANNIERECLEQIIQLILGGTYE